MSWALRLALRNALRSRVRTALTVFGLVVAISALGLLRTVVDAWYAGVEAGSNARLITRSAVSLVFPLPRAYGPRIRQIAGVDAISWGNWFGGVYQTERNFFPQLAVDPDGWFDLYPEFVVDDEGLRAWRADRAGAVVGRRTAERFGWKVGDVVPIRGTIFPGEWRFTIRAIYRGADTRTDETQFFFRWDYLNERARTTMPGTTDKVGWYVVRVADPATVATTSRSVDALFANSLAETLTETEKAFQLGFVAMTEAILQVIEAVSLVIVLIVLAVLANVMTMTARERAAEHATLKAIGFRPRFVAGVVLAESVAVALAGGALGIALTFPLARLFAGLVGTLFPVFEVSTTTVAVQAAATVAVGVLAGAWPAWRGARLPVVDGLRHVG